jgi:hypothetical protein
MPFSEPAYRSASATCMTEESVAPPLLQQLTKVHNMLTVDVAPVPLRLDQIDLPLTLQGAIYPVIPGIPAVAVYPIAAALESVQQQLLEGERVDVAEVREPLRPSRETLDLRKHSPGCFPLALMTPRAVSRRRDEQRRYDESY